jgi:regulator of protease activity HflC (stomatin/prohibitin superfamily)
MIRAIAKQAEAERTRRAKIIAAEGELQASEKLTEAARILGGQEQAITLRYLQTMLDMSNEGSRTIFFPLPVELLGALKAIASGGLKPGSDS